MSTTENHDPETGEIRHEFDAEAADRAAYDAEQYAGQRIRGFISPKDFLAGRPMEFLGQFMGKPRGALYTRLGFLVGPVMATAERTHDSNGKEFQFGPSVWLEGKFDAIIDLTGEMMQSRFAILPKAAGNMIHNVFQKMTAEGANPSGDLNLEIGIEATGKPITYAYVITQFVQRKPTGVQAQLAARRMAAIVNDQKRLAAPSAASKK